MVLNEHAHDKTDFIDGAIQMKANARARKICVVCRAYSEVRHRKCASCNGSLVYEDPELLPLYSTKTNVKPYNHFSGIEINSNSFKVTTGEPDMCNPNSFQSISSILFNIGERADIKQYTGGKRHWLFLECDGGIYTILEKLLFNVYRCSMCNEAMYGLEEFSEHRCCVLHDILAQHEFGWIFPMPGLLHVEMNACKSFFELNWDIMVKDVCSKMGFVTPKSLDYAKRCVDHHKSWRILEILYVAVTDELLVPYIRHCKDSMTEPSVEGYWIWADKVTNPNYLYMQQMVLTFLHAMMLFRTGCRKGNARAIISARDKMSLLFFARNHQRYQRIMTLNRFVEAMMPAEVKNVVHSSYTLSRVGNVGHYQGGDACLEEVNKEAKAWLSPTGVPTPKEWLKVFNNLDTMNEVCINHT